MYRCLQLARKAGLRNVILWWSRYVHNERIQEKGITETGASAINATILLKTEATTRIHLRFSRAMYTMVNFVQNLLFRRKFFVCNTRS